MKRFIGKETTLLGILLAACLVAGAATNAHSLGGAVPEPGGCTVTTLPIPGVAVKANLFLANNVDYLGSVLDPEGNIIGFPYLGLDVYITGKCGKKRIPSSRVHFPGVTISVATAPNDLLSLKIEKELVDPGVAATCFDPSVVPYALVGYAVHRVEDFSKRGYFLSFPDLSLGPVHGQDYAIETEAQIVGLYCPQ